MSVRNDMAEKTSVDQEELATRLAITEAENERLRQEYAHARQTEYRRTAVGLGVVGVLAILGAFLMPGSRTILFALGGTGLFAGVLTLYLTPEQFIAASVGEEVYTALAENESAIVSELGLADDRIYIPSDENDVVHLYVPQDANAAIPAPEALDSVFVIENGTRGLALQPTGTTLFTEFDRALTDEISRDPHELADQLVDGLVEPFELIQRATADVGDDRLTIAVKGSVYGDITRFDHPVPSFIAIGTARALATSVHIDVRAGDTERADHLVTCTWGEGDTVEHNTNSER